MIAIVALAHSIPQMHIPAREWIASVEPVAAVWVVCAVALAFLLTRAVRRIRWRRLVRDEQGAAYSLSLVMVVPIYALLMAVFIEATLIMIAKMGTVFAGYAAARSAIAWEGLPDNDGPEVHARRAGRRTMVPFAAGTDSKLPPTPGALLYVEEYRKRADGRRVAGSYLAAKYAEAHRFVKVDINGPEPQTWDGRITADIRYERPFSIPVVGRLLGRRSVERGGIWVFSIRTQISLTSDAPMNETRTLGIDYHPD